MKPKKPLIVLTGGGTAGHVMPHVSLLSEFYEKGWSLLYIGSKAMERDTMKAHGVEFVEVSSGKLRRYFSWDNFFDHFRLLWGILQSLRILWHRSPAVVFSKGGYVSVPICVAAWILRIPVVTHESDFSPGLATRLIMPLARRVCYSFSASGKFFPSPKGVHTGNPIRRELGEGSPAEGFRLCGFSSEGLPVLLVMGGSSGALALNEFMYRNLSAILTRFRVVHITGKEKNQEVLQEGYRHFSYVTHELAHLYAVTQVVLSRAGANSVFEFDALGIPMVLIPLSVGSRGDQVENAELMVGTGRARMILQSELGLERFWKEVEALPPRQKNELHVGDAGKKIVDVLSREIR
jgi:UDP-N-acetylglucosamine--N-acetylmuramyl-(pentapeptide) pyrophosphoryl-undecaprenol N-acetylglucosamine transferase